MPTAVLVALVSDVAMIEPELRKVPAKVPDTSYLMPVTCGGTRLARPGLTTRKLALPVLARIEPLLMMPAVGPLIVVEVMKIPSLAGNVTSGFGPAAGSKKPVKVPALLIAPLMVDPEITRSFNPSRFGNAGASPCATLNPTMCPCTAAGAKKRPALPRFVL